MRQPPKRWRWWCCSCWWRRRPCKRWRTCGGCPRGSRGRRCSPWRVGGGGARRRRRVNFRPLKKEGSVGEIGVVGTLPSGNHVSRVISRTIIIRIPLRIRMMQFPYPDRLKERQMTFQLLLSKEEQTTLAEHGNPDNLHNASSQ